MVPKQKADVPLPRVLATNEGTSKELFPSCFSTSVFGATTWSARSRGEQDARAHGVPVGSTRCLQCKLSVGTLHMAQGQEGTGRGAEAVPEGQGCKACAISQSSAQASGPAGRGGERGKEAHQRRG